MHQVWKLEISFKLENSFLTLPRFPRQNQCRKSVLTRHIERSKSPLKNFIRCSCILKQYRRWIRRKKAKISAVSRYFKASESFIVAKKLQLKRKYRLLYQGPLLHALVCLDKAHERALGVKQKAIQQVQIAHHTALEDVKKQVDKAMYATRILCLL